MASSLTPYGFKAVNELGGLPYAGSTRSFLIDPAGYAVNIYNGSIVNVNANGYLNIVVTNGDNSTPFPAGTIGVFVGCTYVNAQGQVIYSNYYPAGTTGVVSAYVIDDDRAVFQVQSSGTVTQAALGANVFLTAVQATGTGSTTTGVSSTTVVPGTGAIQTGGAFRVVGFVNMQGFSTVGDANTDILVKFNPGSHSYSNATGI